MRTPRRHRLWWARVTAGAVAAVALLGGGLIAFWSSDHPAPLGPVTELPPVTVPLPTKHWVDSGN
ncbi:hypothetical protein [Nocardia sp. NPDC004711]